MRVIILIVLMAAFFFSCNKNNDATPAASKPTKPDTGSVSKLSADDSLHLAVFNVMPQITVVSVSENNLNMKFNENIDLLYTAAGYQKISSIHLLEDFKNSQLNGFDFTTVAEAGNVTLNWVDDNLNNVILKSTTDTTINKIKMVKINVHRTFSFFKTYDSAKSAIAEQDLILKQTADIITFSSYSYFNLKNYPVTSISAKVIYVKGS